MKKFFLPFVVSVSILSACQVKNNDATVKDETSSSEKSEAYYQITSNPISITKDQEYIVTLKTMDTWEFSVENNQDVTQWLVLKSQDKALADQKDVAHIQSVETDSSTLTIAIDTSKITGFTTNGGADLYILPDEASIVGAGDNHAQYTSSAIQIGEYVIPEVSINGQIEGEVTQEDGLVFKDNEVTFNLTVGNQEWDTDLIDNQGASITLQDGDGYYSSDYIFSDQGLSDEMKAGSIHYSIQPEDLQITNSGYSLGEDGGGRNWSEIGGDGNGNYNLNFALDGLEYNGLPVTAQNFQIHVYCYGRTFQINDGSIYANDVAKWSTTAENNLPVLCDDYTDDLTIDWANGIDASKVKAEDLTLTMESQYGDTLTLKAGENFTIDASKNQTVIHVDYIYWAYTPVYQTLTVDVAKDQVTWDQEVYKLDTISHTYNIASVYVYNVMAGGQTGTQTWTIYGLDGLESWQQIFDSPTYTLSAEIDGKTQFYSEANGGNLVDEEVATAYDASKDTNLQLLNNTIYLTRQYDQTEVKIVNSQEITFNKVYSKAELAIKNPQDCTSVKARSGFILGNSWEEHLRWPWQTFINEGYQGGRS